MLYQMKKTLGLYFHACLRVFKTREGTITLFNSFIQKLKVPAIYISSALGMVVYETLKLNYLINEVLTLSK